jgi:hypothetical protein
MDGGSGGSTGNAGSGGTGSGQPTHPIKLTLVSAVASVECQPISPSDSLSVSLCLAYDNSVGGPTQVFPDEGRLVLGSMVTRFDVTPASFDVTGGSSFSCVVTDKVAATATGETACSWCGAGGATAELDVRIGSEPRTITRPLDSLGCSK